MLEPSYGLIVEGIYDESVFRELVGRVVASEVTIEVRPCGGVTRLRARFPGFLRELEHAVQGKPVSKALVVRDCDGRDPDAVVREMSQILRDRRFAFPRGVHFCAVRQKMDAWLLADVGAVNALARERGGREVTAVHGPLEELPDPKEILRRLLSEARLPYDAKLCGEIARRADLEILRYRCPSFRSFEKKVLDC